MHRTAPKLSLPHARQERKDTNDGVSERVYPPDVFTLLYVLLPSADSVASLSVTDGRLYKPLKQSMSLCPAHQLRLLQCLFIDQCKASFSLPAPLRGGHCESPACTNHHPPPVLCILFSLVTLKYTVGATCKSCAEWREFVSVSWRRHSAVCRSVCAV